MFQFSKWYEQHKTDLNKSRRDKYATDPEHRKHVRELNAASRARRKEEEEQELSAAEAARRIAEPARDWKEFEVDLPDGSKGLAFTVGALASATRRSIQSIRAWEAKGVIPPPDARSPKGDRLYTIALIEKIVQDLEAAGRLKDTKRQRSGPSHVEKCVRYSDGTEKLETLFLVAAVARVVRKTIVTVQNWESSGTLPETPFRASSRRYRLYTLGQIRVIDKAWRAADQMLRTAEAKAEFHRAVLAGWAELNIPGAVLVETAEDSATAEVQP